MGVSGSRRGPPDASSGIVAARPVLGDPAVVDAENVDLLDREAGGPLGSSRSLTWYFAHASPVPVRSLVRARIAGCPG